MADTNGDHLELYRKHRPRTFKQVLGQPEVVRQLSEMVEKNRVPHAIAFAGGSGCGKTTLARIMVGKLECAENDYTEINAAGEGRGIDTIRDIKNTMWGSPMYGGKTRIWLFDEAHKLTNDAQNSLLKMLEDPPPHVYFFLCTTEFNKLIKAVQTRCTEIRVKELQPSVMRELLTRVCDKEGIKLADTVADRLVEVAEGSPRKALVLLHQIKDLDTDEARINVLLADDAKTQSIQIARALLDKKTTWPQMAKILKGVTEDPESLRHMVLAYASKVILDAGPMSGQAFKMIDAFESAFYDSKRAGLIRACYQVVADR